MKSVEIHKESICTFCINDEGLCCHKKQIKHQLKITFEGFGCGEEGSGFNSLVALLEKVGVMHSSEDPLNDVFIDQEGFEYILEPHDLSMLAKNATVAINAQPLKIR